MSRKYKFHDSSGLFFISHAVVYWIDVFVKNEYRQVIHDSLKHCMEKKGLAVSFVDRPYSSTRDYAGEKRQLDSLLMIE